MNRFVMSLYLGWVFNPVGAPFEISQGQEDSRELFPNRLGKLRTHRKGARGRRRGRQREGGGAYTVALELKILLVMKTCSSKQT